MTQTDRMMTEIEVAEMLGIKPQTLTAWRCRGSNDLRFVKLGRVVRYRLSDVEAFIERHAATCTAEAN